MPAGFCSSWEIISNVNFEGYMIALGKSLTRADITSLLKDSVAVFHCAPTWTQL